MDVKHTFSSMPVTVGPVGRNAPPARSAITRSARTPSAREGLSVAISIGFSSIRIWGISHLRLLNNAGITVFTVMKKPSQLQLVIINHLNTEFP